MLSDIHFEPFRDPAKLASLRTAPVDAWQAILAAPASVTQAADFQRLQAACPVHGLDTAWPLLSRSLAQAAARLPHPLFVTVSGDLLSHAFDCRFKSLAPRASEEELSAFAAKTVDFVTAQLREAFPNSPVYLALGNNDSGCTDYREDRNSAFLQHVAESFASAAGSGESGQTILREFSDEGDYNIALPGPLHDSRLFVLQDIFETGRYAGCGGKLNPSAAETQLAWLTAQLADARAHRQHVWVMAHVPPGIDMYSTIHNGSKVCSGQPPVMFLGNEKIADVLTAYPDVIALAIFAHSHADELRFLHAAGGETGVSAKLVSSISPVNGNLPTFTVAQVDPHTAVLLDYTVFLVGEGVASKPEYSFRETYKLPDVSGASLHALTSGFLADRAGEAAASQAYQRLYFAGDTGFHAAVMALFWRSYACSLTEDRAYTFRTCACAAEGSSKQ